MAAESDWAQAWAQSTRARVDQCAARSRAMDASVDVPPECLVQMQSNPAVEILLARAYDLEEHGSLRACDGDADDGAGLEELPSVEALRDEQNTLWADESVHFGVARAKEGKYAEALVAYAKALDLCPQHADAHVGRGAAFANQSRLSEAVSEFKRALEIDPEHRNARIYHDATLEKLRAKQTQAGQRRQAPAAPEPSRGGLHAVGAAAVDPRPPPRPAQMGWEGGRSTTSALPGQAAPLGAGLTAMPPPASAGVGGGSAPSRAELEDRPAPAEADRAGRHKEKSRKRSSKDGSSRRAKKHKSKKSKRRSRKHDDSNSSSSSEKPVPPRSTAPELRAAHAPCGSTGADLGSVAGDAQPGGGGSALDEASRERLLRLAGGVDTSGKPGGYAFV